jgi:flagellar biosynthesis/type III secretory pathway chaperone
MTESSVQRCPHCSELEEELQELIEIRDCLVKKLESVQRDLATDEREWKVLAEELDCEPTREEMVKTIRLLRQRKV